MKEVHTDTCILRREESLTADLCDCWSFGFEWREVAWIRHYHSVQTLKRSLERVDDTDPRPQLPDDICARGFEL